MNFSGVFQCEVSLFVPRQTRSEYRRTGTGGQTSIVGAVRALRTRRPPRFHFSEESQVVSKRTGISFLTATVRRDGGVILKSESAAGIVPRIRTRFPST